MLVFLAIGVREMERIHWSGRQSWEVLFCDLCDRRVGVGFWLLVSAVFESRMREPREKWIAECKGWQNREVLLSKRVGIGFAPIVKR